MLRMLGAEPEVTEIAMKGNATLATIERIAWQQEWMMTARPFPEGNTIVVIVENIFEERVGRYFWRIIGV